MAMVFLGTTSNVILPDNWCPRNYGNPMWLDIVTLLGLVLIIYLLYKVVLRDDG